MALQVVNIDDVIDFNPLFAKGVNSRFDIIKKKKLAAFD